jgi:hypothetical protein
MSTPTLAESAGVCGQSSNSADILRTQIEIGANVVALFKLPMPVKELAGIIRHLEVVHGRELLMMEKPKGWFSFFHSIPTQER